MISAKHLSVVSTLLISSTGLTSAANLMLDFGSQTITGGQEANSPGHATGAISAAETTWNKISSSAATSSLSYADGTSASGVTLTMGLESSAGSSSMSYSAAPALNTTAVVGGGSAINQQVYNGTTSIYGNGSFSPTTTSVSTTGRDGFLGTTGSAMGIRVDGLASGTYSLLTMARNTNTNSEIAAPMAVYATSGTLQSSLAFSSLASSSQANTTYATVGYAGQYNTFTEGENYVSMTVTIGEGESLYLVVDGSAAETRGFLNSVQIAAIPEPTALLLGGFSLLGLLRRRRC